MNAIVRCGADATRTTVVAVAVDGQAALADAVRTLTAFLGQEWHAGVSAAMAAVSACDGLNGSLSPPVSQSARPTCSISAHKTRTRVVAHAVLATFSLLLNAGDTGSGALFVALDRLPGLLRAVLARLTTLVRI